LERSPSAYLSTLLGAPTFKYFNVAVATAEAAIAATTKHLADPQHPETSVVRALSLREIAALGLTAGDVKPAWPRSGAVPVRVRFRIRPL